MAKNRLFDPKNDTPVEARGRALRESGYRGPMTADGYVDHRTDEEWLDDARRQHGVTDDARAADK